MRRLLRAATLVIWILTAADAFAACHAVTSAGSGSRTGANWSNAYAGLPSTLVRGDIYYLADGGYSPYTFSTAASGTTIIEIRKAQSYDFGRASDGCSNDISSGWNASTMGASQAIFSGGRTLTINASYFTFNGNGQYTGAGCGGGPGSTVSSNPPAPADCGIKLVGSGGIGEAVQANAGNYTLEYVEVLGDATPADNADNEIWDISSSGSSTFNHIYGHNAGAVYIQDGPGNITVEHSYFWGTEVGGVLSDGTHGQAMYEVNTNNGTIFANVWRDIAGTAVWTFGSGGTDNNWVFYDNVVWWDQANPGYGGLSDAALDCINGNLCTNFYFYQNTIVGCVYGEYGPQCGLGWADGASGGSVTVENNLWYNNSSVVLSTNGTTVVEDHNSFINSPSFGGGTGDVSVSSGGPNPFTNWPSSNFTLAGDNSDWNNRVSLSPAYNTDLAGNGFSTDRGAFQYNGSQSQVHPPTSLSVSVQ